MNSKKNAVLASADGLKKRDKTQFGKNIKKARTKDITQSGNAKEKSDTKDDIEG